MENVAQNDSRAVALHCWGVAAQAILRKSSSGVRPTLMPSSEEEHDLLCVRNVIGRVAAGGSPWVPDEELLPEQRGRLTAIVRDRGGSPAGVIAAIAIQLGEGHPDVDYAIERMIALT